MKQAEIALAKAQQDKAGTDIIAPTSGTLYLAEDIAAESKVSTGQTFANIGNAKDLWIEAVLNDDQKTKVRLGQFASYRLGGRDIQGTVQDIEEPAADEGDETVPVKVRVRISVPEEAGEGIQSGTKVTVRLSP